MNKTILDNAISSIEIGIEDYKLSEQNNRRIVSSARNIYAGILLLYKHKLITLDSSETLIKKRVLPYLNKDTNEIEWKGKGKNTIDFHDIRERFNTLHVTTKWEIIEEINKYRNNIEHYYTEVNYEGAKTMISNCFIVIDSFIRDELYEDPQNLFKSSSWEILLETNQFCIELRKTCEKNLHNLKWYNENIRKAFLKISCDKCGSSLINSMHSHEEIDIEASSEEFICMSCDNNFEYGDKINEIIENYYEDKNNSVIWEIKDGGDGYTHTTDCPECDGIYLYYENICSKCGHESVTECDDCGELYSPETISLGEGCSYCAYRWEKIMRE